MVDRSKCIKTIHIRDGKTIKEIDIERNLEAELYDPSNAATKPKTVNIDPKILSIASGI